MRNLTDFVSEKGLTPQERNLNQTNHLKGMLSGISKFSKTAAVVNHVMKGLDNLLSV